MPKYVPTTEELEKSHPCFICGCEIFGNDETCDNELCKQQMQIFKDDFWEDIYSYQVDY